ncbi:MAG: glycosyltransferase family 4 protein [Anaerolineae bacterium]|nr:glycosyltransferase family 4 protein [Anaerolineae bacterium]MDW8173760.1 glycosyltransferase family 4 protein [Anaerolineae bacterium]
MNDERLLLFNLRTDLDDHILGFTSGWISALLAHYGAIDVITMHRGRIAFDERVRVCSIGRERGWPVLLRLLAFYGHLLRLLLTHRYQAVFSHMTPLLSILAAPVLHLFGLRLVTWYTHRQRHRQIAWAARLSWRVVSAVETSFPIPTPKLRVLGHGIPTDFFTPDPAVQPDEPPLLALVARLTPIKRQHLAIEALAKLKGCRLVLVGGVPDGYEAEYADQLRAQVASLSLTERVIFAGEQTPEQVRTWYRRASLALNLSPVGLFDKAALEGMACATPTLVCNPAFAPLLGEQKAALLLPEDLDAAQLARAVQSWLSRPSAERHALGLALRCAVMEQHSLECLAARLAHVLRTGESK